MGRTLTITDDELGATASVRIEHTASGQPLVKELRFVADEGCGLSSAVLALMEDLGLTLPEQAPAVKAPARERKKPAAPAPAAARKPAARRQPAPPAARRAPTEPARPHAALAAPPVQALPAAAPTFTEPEPAPAPQQRGRRTGPPPGPTELREVFRRNRGSLQAMADEFGSSVSSVSGWLRRAREGGAKIDLAGLPEPAAAS